jgi:hypothetical protein
LRLGNLFNKLLQVFFKFLQFLKLHHRSVSSS